MKSKGFNNEELQDTPALQKELQNMPACKEICEAATLQALLDAAAHIPCIPMMMHPSKLFLQISSLQDNTRTTKKKRKRSNKRQINNVKKRFI